jgi:hypothetical protein
MNRARAAKIRTLALGVTSALLACNQSPTPPVGTVITTAVVVMPEHFLGTLPCSDDEGAPKIFRAELIDVTDGLDEESPRVRSGLVSCKRGAYFESVTPGHRYIADISLYPRSDLDVDAETNATVDDSGAEVEPTWTTTCYGTDLPPGEGLGGADNQGEGGAGEISIGVYAYTQARTYVRGCLPLTRGTAPGETGVQLSLARSLGRLECGDDEGQVSRFVVLGEDGELPEGGLGGAGGSSGTEPDSGSSFACSESLTITGLRDGESYTYDLVAFEADEEEPRWSTTCRVTARSGVIARATCEPLQPLR